MPAAIFYPENGSSKAAEAICKTCPVKQPCRDASRGELGIWGGLTERGRAFIHGTP